MLVDGDDEVRPGREVAVDRAHADAGLRGDVAYRCVHAGGDEHGGSGVEQCLFIAPGVRPLEPGVGPLARGRSAWLLIEVGQSSSPLPCRLATVPALAKRSVVPYVERSAVPLAIMPQIGRDR